MKEVAAALSLKSFIKKAFQGIASICVQIAFLAVPFLLINFSFSTFINKNKENKLNPNQVNDQTSQNQELEKPAGVNFDKSDKLIVDTTFDLRLVNNLRP